MYQRGIRRLRNCCKRQLLYSSVCYRQKKEKNIQMLHIHLHEEYIKSISNFQHIFIYIYTHTHTHIFLAIHLIPKYHFCFTESSIINIWNKTSVRYCATKVSLMVQLLLVLLASYMMSQLCNFHINNVLTVYIHSGNLSP